MLRLNFQPPKKFSLQDSRVCKNVSDLHVTGDNILQNVTRYARKQLIMDLILEVYGSMFIGLKDRKIQILVIFRPALRWDNFDFDP